MGPVTTRFALDLATAMFICMGVFTIGRPLFVREEWHLRNYPIPFIQTLGAVELLTTFLLVIPEMRPWGIATGGVIAFTTAVTLLSHRQYLWSLPVILLLVSLIPASQAA